MKKETKYFWATLVLWISGAIIGPFLIMLAAVKSSWILGLVGVSVFLIGTIGGFRVLRASIKDSCRQADEEMKDWINQLAKVQSAMEYAKTRPLQEAIGILSAADIYLDGFDEKFCFPKACWHTCNSNELVAVTLATIVRGCKHGDHKIAVKIYKELGKLLAGQAKVNPYQALAVATLLQRLGIDLAGECYGIGG